MDDENRTNGWQNPILPKKRDDVHHNPKTLWLIRTIAALALGIMIGYLIWGVDWHRATEEYQHQSHAAAETVYRPASAGGYHHGETHHRN